MSLTKNLKEKKTIIRVCPERDEDYDGMTSDMAKGKR